MKKLKALLVDDERNALEGLEEILQLYCPDVEIVGMAGSVNEAVSKFLEVSPDIVFLDVQMPGGSGFELVDIIRSKSCSLVFVTAHTDYAVKAFRVDAIDYLLKPVSYSELRVAVAKAIQYREKNATAAQAPEHIVRISGTSGIYFVPGNEIIGIEADGRYSVVHLKSGDKRMVTRNVGEFEIELEAHGFFRVHKSWLINCSYVNRVVNVDGGTVELANGHRVLISRRKRAEFLKRMKI